MKIMSDTQDLVNTDIFSIFYGPHRKKTYHGLELGKVQTTCIVREDPSEAVWFGSVLFVKAFSQTISVQNFRMFTVVCSATKTS